MSDIDIGFQEFVSRYKNEIPKNVDFNKIKDFCLLAYSMGYADRIEEEQRVNNGKSSST